MNEATCSVEGCERPAICRGWCPTHYQRWKKHGDPVKVGRPGRPMKIRPEKTPRLGPLERLMVARIFMDRPVDALANCPDSQCWISTYKPNADGYTVIGSGPGTTYGHILSYRANVGPIPEKFTIDHLCRNPPCWNPDHLEAVPRGTNTSRGASPGANAVRTGLCKRGHSLDDAYLMGPREYRICRPCQRAHAYAKYHHITIEEALEILYGKP